MKKKKLNKLKNEIFYKLSDDISNWTDYTVESLNENVDDFRKLEERQDKTELELHVYSKYIASQLDKIKEDIASLRGEKWEITPPKSSGKDNWNTKCSDDYSGHYIRFNENKMPLVPFTIGDQQYLHGELIRFNNPDVNGRIIDFKDFRQHFDALLQNMERALFGELGHPEKFDIRLSNVSHVIEEIEFREDRKGWYLYGKFRVLDTEAGNKTKMLISLGAPLCSMYRMAGMVDDDNMIHIKKLFTFDIDFMHNGWQSIKERR